MTDSELDKTAKRLKGWATISIPTVAQASASGVLSVQIACPGSPQVGTERAICNQIPRTAYPRQCQAALADLAPASTGLLRRAAETDPEAASLL